MSTLSSGLPLYTSDNQLLEPTNLEKPSNLRTHRDLKEAAFKELYEVDRTVKEILSGRYSRVALQFPDELLGDSTRVYELVYKGINQAGALREEAQSRDTVGDSQRVNFNRDECCGTQSTQTKSAREEDAGAGDTTTNGGCFCKLPPTQQKKPPSTTPDREKKVFILADTSFSACCIDEIAAEHCLADVLVHYGRSCLSPTTRLPVIYVFTTNLLSLPAVAESFRTTFPGKSQKVVLMADVTYSSHVPELYRLLVEDGYGNVFATKVVHNPTSLIPNRTLPPGCEGEGGEGLKAYELFHIAPPLPSLLLVLASRVSGIYTYNTTTTPLTCSQETTVALLRRRYALLSHARSAGIIGILVNTLNVKNYLPVISMLKEQIRNAGRKSYLVVVGKVNVEKVANFAEIEVWVGVGCWEQGIVGSESGREFYRPVVTPYELGVALDKSRAWTGEWVTDFESLLKINFGNTESKDRERGGGREDEEDEEDEDEPPEFDLRTGKYVSAARPLRQKSRGIKPAEEGTDSSSSSALIHTSNSSLSTTGDVLSPAAQFLWNKRSWRGLGSDVQIEYESPGALVEVGRSGIARGYTLGGEGEKR